MAPNAAQPPRAPVPVPDANGALRDDHNGTPPPGTHADGDFLADAHPIEPSFRHFAESLSDLVWSARPDGATDFYNRRFLEFVGRGQEEMSGWAWTGIVHPEDVETAVRTWQHAAATGGEYELEFRLRRYDGEYRWHRSRGSASRDEAGRITRWFGTCTDIDDRRRAEAALRESEGRFRALMEQAPFAVQVFSPDGRTLRVNRAWEELWGVTLEAVADYNVLADPQLEARGILPLLRRVFAGETLRLPIHRYDPEETVPGRTRHSDPTRWIETIAYPVKDADGRVLEVVVIHRDVTARRRAEDALHQEEQRLRLALEAGRMGHWDWDIPTGRLAWSDNLEEVHGLPPGTFDGTMEGFRRLIHPEDVERLETAIGRSIEEGSGYDTEFRIVRPDGSIAWMMGKGRAFLDESGRAVRMAGFGMDITERKRAEEARRQIERRFARFMQHLPGLAWIKDSRGRYVYANDDAMRAFGAARDTLYGRTDDEVFPPETAALFRENDRRALESGAGIRTIESLEHADGTVRHSLVSKFPIPIPGTDPGENDGQGEVLVGGMAIDITDRLEMESALKEADRRKDEFLATLAHELRNPLAPIRNGLQILQMAGGDPSILDEARTLMERQVAHMVRLIDDLLDVSRITRDRLELRRERVDLANVIGAAVETSRPLIEASRHRLAVALPPGPIPVDADPTRLAQVFANLLNNAAKYTEPGGQIVLEAELRGDEVIATVRDDGVGIPPELLPRVFDLFMQVDRSLERSQGGLGIGLTLVRRLVEMHGGSIEARSDGRGRGSAFVVRLPLAGPPEGTVPAGGEPGAGLRSGGGSDSASRRRILVVDDNRDSADTLARLLGLTGHEARTANDGGEAVAIAEEYRPEVILLDIGLPVMNGYEVARTIRSRPWGRNVVIVALTGWGQDGDRRQSQEAGIDHHLVKPVDPRVLRELLARPDRIRPG